MTEKQKTPTKRRKIPHEVKLKLAAEHLSVAIRAIKIALRELEKILPNNYGDT